MAKTDFQDGVTVVAADFLNKIFGGGTEDSHVHDGGTDDGSASKVDLGDHIDYGTNGGASVTNDDASTHEVTHEHSGAGDAKWVTDIVSALVKVVSPILEATTSVRTGLIETPSDNLSLDKQAGGDANILLGNITASGTAFLDVIRSAQVDFEDGGGNSGQGSALARNTAKAWGKVNQSGGSYTLGNSYGIDSITKNSTGNVTVTLTNAPASWDDLCIMAKIEGNTGKADIKDPGTASDEIEVDLLDNAGTSNVDDSFHIMVFY
jgi:hypothetical protein